MLDAARSCVSQSMESMVVSHAIEVDRAIDACEVRVSFQRLIETFGFSNVWMCGPLNGDGAVEHAGTLMCTRPAAWTKAYVARRLWEHDTVLREMRHHERAVAWSEIRVWRESATKGLPVCPVVRLAMQHGADCGLMVPVIEANGRLGMVEIAGKGIDITPSLKAGLTLAAEHAHRKMTMHARKCRQAVRLTKREAEVLQWIATGKSDWQIGQILQISSKTVNYHAENVKRKFGVATRMQAVVAAIACGNVSV